MIGALLAFTAATMPAPGPYNDAWPPLRFRGDMDNITISLVPRGAGNGAMESRCGKAPDGLEFEGCSNQLGRWIVLLNPCLWPEADDYARLFCHELGHLHGWSGLHPAE